MSASPDGDRTAAGRSPIGRADALVIGAGIVGLSVALHLQARGRDVLLIDREPPGRGTSFGNAGVIERASVVPYAFPRDLATLVRHALNRGSDVRHDPRWLPRVLPWLARYWWHSAPRRLARAARDMLPLIERSVEEHRRLAEAAGTSAISLIRPVGMLRVHRDAALHERAASEARALADVHGLNLDVLDSDALRALEPALSDAAVGALHWRDPHAVRDPGALCAALAGLFERRGGTIERAAARRLAPRSDGWSLALADGRDVVARDGVVALGPWSPDLLRPLGYRLPLAVKRGYHRHYAARDGAMLDRPVIDEEAGLVLAPMSRGVRLSTGVELAAPEAPPNGVQLERAERIARTLFPLGERLDAVPWLGRRPCLPDMRPVIGAAPRHAKLWLAFGHAHHGLTLGPATGRLLAEMIVGERPFTDPAPYAAARFGRAASF